MSHVHAGPADVPPAIDLLVPGVWHNESLPKRRPEPWFGLFPTGEQVALRCATVAVTAAGADECIGARSRIAVTETPAPLALVRGLPHPQEGPLVTATATHGAATLLRAGTTVTLAFNDRPYTLQAAWVTGQPAGRLRLTFSDGSTTQPIAYAEGMTVQDAERDGDYRFLWAGDLDRDGRPDLLLRANEIWEIWGQRLTFDIMLGAC